ncbi:universal stress protein [Streptomyces halobius]|uniref:Universal stress protein n=1 Tax=Streptomyces halobius TaxID=2879846 RepID=A0ABY4MGX7_9ACTN|nr:universal stress protein [Streptomyces halobius]UQA97054.1 universal stress protein [Streptomyces halobius]
MTRPVAVGLDGSPAALVAADWGAREALCRELPLRLVYAWEWQPYTYAPLAGTDAPRPWSERVPREAAAELRNRYPGLEITADHLTGPPPEVLCEVATEAELLALGTAGFGALAGFFLGSVAMSAVAHTEQPVVLVRAETTAADEYLPATDGRPPTAMAYRPVVLGLDLSRPCDEVIRFAFETTALRAAPLRVIRGWKPPAYFLYGVTGEPSLRDDLAEQETEGLRTVLLPWREKYPGIDVTEHCVMGEPAHFLADAGADAGLVIIGRRSRRSWAGPPRTGHIAHAVLHHCPAPVAVIPHD